MAVAKAAQFMSIVPDSARVVVGVAADCRRRARSTWLDNRWVRRSTSTSTTRSTTMTTIHRRMHVLSLDTDAWDCLRLLFDCEGVGLRNQIAKAQLSADALALKFVCIIIGVMALCLASCLAQPTHSPRRDRERREESLQGGVYCGNGKWGVLWKVGNGEWGMGKVGKVGNGPPSTPS